MLQRLGPQRRIYEEIQKIEANEFHYQEQTDPIEYVEDMCENMQLFAKEDFLTGDQLLFEFNAEVIGSVLNLLTPDKVNLLLLSPEHEGRCPLQEKWFGTQYSVEEIQQQWRDRWASDLELNSDFHLPAENQFIATDFTLKPSDCEHTEFPVKVTDTERGCVWYKKDNKFKIPKAYVWFHLISPLIQKSPKKWLEFFGTDSSPKGRWRSLYKRPIDKRTADLQWRIVHGAIATNGHRVHLDPTVGLVLFDVMVNVLLYNVSEPAYEADVAQLEYKLTAGEHGLVIKVKGFNHKLRLLFNLMVDHLADFSAPPDVFNMFTEQLKKSYFNILIKPEKLAKDVRLLILEAERWSVMQKHQAVVEGVSVDELMEFVRSFKEELYAEGLVQGNLTHTVHTTHTHTQHSHAPPPPPSTSTPLPPPTTTIPPTLPSNTTNTNTTIITNNTITNTTTITNTANTTNSNTTNTNTTIITNNTITNTTATTITNTANTTNSNTTNTNTTIITNNTITNTTATTLTNTANTTNSNTTNTNTTIITNNTITNTTTITNTANTTNSNTTNTNTTIITNNTITNTTTITNTANTTNSNTTNTNTTIITNNTITNTTTITNTANTTNSNTTNTNTTIITNNTITNTTTITNTANTTNSNTTNTNTTIITNNTITNTTTITNTANTTNSNTTNTNTTIITNNTITNTPPPPSPTLPTPPTVTPPTLIPPSSPITPLPTPPPPPSPTLPTPPTEAVDFLNYLTDKLQYRKLSAEVPVQFRVVELPQTHSVCKVKSLNKGDANSEVTVYYQSGAKNLREHTLMELVVMHMEEPCFDFLRTKETLGYHVYPTCRNTSGILGFSVTVETQATKFSPEHVEMKMEEFLQSFGEMLAALTDDAFRSHVTALVKLKQCEDTHLGEEVERHWNEVITQQYVFDRLHHEIEALKLISKDELI
ncbi:hypothetical protein QTP70_035207 [Hemibagrus guttatus]|uniref:Nardilysin n=1 Tax=Hemibagrus guttatus TaxID=175788 RepID=A0AAE0V7V1_9TELE|nr:hypothetical protein QTP70_035207 [Hemibagrus guttatus]